MRLTVVNIKSIYISYIYVYLHYSLLFINVYKPLINALTLNGTHHKWIIWDT